jgi:hypothetical protein
MTPEQQELALNALCTILQRITLTVAEDWVAPNPLASERSSMAQYPGTLADFIFETIQEITKPNDEPTTDNMDDNP